MNIVFHKRLRNFFDSEIQQMRWFANEGKVSSFVKSQQNA